MFAFLIILTISFISAEFNYRSNKLDSNYFSGDIISGVINISFNQESSKGLFTSNFPGNITLFDLLEENSINGYDCSTADCDSDYLTESQINSLDLEPGVSKVIGFKITTSDLDTVESLKFNLASNVESSCFQQALIDVLDKNEKLIQNYKYKFPACVIKRGGCFNASLISGGYVNPIIGSNRYCEKITLDSAAGYELGAKVTKLGIDNGLLKMELFDSDGNYLKGCDLPALTQNTQEVGCVVNYTNVKQKEHLICIHSELDDEKYSIRAEQSGLNCGTSNKDSNVFNVDYEIFVKNMQFDTFNIGINSVSYEINNNQESFLDYINNYLYDKYLGICPSTGCIIPFEISSTQQQTITISGVELKYRSSIGSITGNSIYLLGKSDAKIDSGVLELDLFPAGFFIPFNSTAKKFELYLDGKSLLSKNINVTKSFDFELNPKVVLLGIDTTFKAITNDNITSSNWNFGNGDVKNSNSNSILYRYSQEGEYTLNVELTRKDGMIGKKSFNILVGNANESANKLIKDYDSRIKNLTINIDSYPPWIAGEIKKKYNPLELNSSLTKIREDLSNSATDEDYIDVVKKLLSLDIPKRISTTRISNLPVIAGSNNINTEFLKKVSGVENADLDDEKIIKDINDWTLNNYDANIYSEVLSKFDSSENKVDILTKVRVDLTQKGTGENGAFLFIDYPIDSISFSENYFEKPVDSGTYVPVSGSKTIEFSVPEYVKLEDLGIYVSPDISKLGGVYENIPFVEKQSFKWLLFVILILILLILVLVVYIFLQEWYKRKYESHLFKNKDELYNLINFVYNSRANSLSDNETKKKLVKSGWKGEQISYAFNKINGKRTGMWEIPLFKRKENLEVEREIQKRHSGGIDTRFIKRS